MIYMMEKDNSISLDAHISGFIRAIDNLTKEHPVHSIQILILMYSAIDQFSWLSVNSIRHSPQDFKDWVDVYMEPEENIGCTAEEIWAARNGLLHMGTAESQNTRNGVLKIGYTSGNAIPKAENEFYRIIDINKLIKCFMDSSIKFSIASKINPIKDIVENKIKDIIFVLDGKYD